MAGADFLAALEASYFLGALAPVDFLAVYFVLAIFKYFFSNKYEIFYENLLTI